MYMVYMYIHYPYFLNIFFVHRTHAIFFARKFNPGDVQLKLSKPYGQQMFSFGTPFGTSLSFSSPAGLDVTSSDGENLKQGEFVRI